MRKKLKSIAAVIPAALLVICTLPLYVLPVSAASSAGTEEALVKAVNKGSDVKLT